MSINTNMSNGLMCKIDNADHDLFFSLVDYRNNLFTSDDPKKIIEFFNGFDNRNQLIQWMKERPKGISNIHEVEGDKDIIVVIPTADFEGKYARECRQNIFRGLHIIFVESGRGGDFYFNYAHNCNVGIKKAMEYNPKWIVVSNDDMIKIDNSSKLREALYNLRSEYPTIVFTSRSGKYHSRDVIISNRTLRRNFALYMKGNLERRKLKIEHFYKITYLIGSTHGMYPLFYKPQFIMKYFGSFSIFNYKVVELFNGNIFDESYINGTEDIDLAWRIRQLSIVTEFIDFNIDDIIGGTLGSYNFTRRLRGLANDCYMNFKVEKGELKVL